MVKEMINKHNGFMIPKLAIDEMDGILESVKYTFMYFSPSWA